MSESKWLSYECGVMSGLNRGDQVFILRDRSVFISDARNMIHGDKWIPVKFPDAPVSDSSIVTALRDLIGPIDSTRPFGFNSGVEAAIKVVREFEGRGDLK